MPAKKLAVLVSIAGHSTHVEAIVGKIIGYPKPAHKIHTALEVASLYVHHQNDESDDFATYIADPTKYYHGGSIESGVEKALYVGGKSLAVDGAIVITIHGNMYPSNEHEQQQYPTKAFLDAIYKKVTAKAGKDAKFPVFCSKHLAVDASDAQEVYAKYTDPDNKVQLTAGSIIPWCWRDELHATNLPLNCHIGEGIVVGYRDIDSFGIHAIEALQCQMERRMGGETGIRAVRFFGDASMWQAYADSGRSEQLLNHCLERTPNLGMDPRVAIPLSSQGGMLLIDYVDSTKGTVLMAKGWTYETPDGAFQAFFKLTGDRDFHRIRYRQQLILPTAQFRPLVHAIDNWVNEAPAKRKPFCPLERTLLSTCMLDLMMKQRRGDGAIAWPDLDKIKYTTIEHPYATGPMPAPL